VTPSSTTSATDRPERDNGRAARHRFDHHQAERLGPVDRKQQSRGIGEKFLFGFIVNFANQPDLVAVDLRFKPFLEVTPLTARYFCRDAKRHSGGARNADCGLRALLGGEPAEKGKIKIRFRSRGGTDWQADNSLRAVPRPTQHLRI
jgi:hypothetical protein